ncbi:S41 family peptidase [Ekhidna sp.]
MRRLLFIFLTVIVSFGYAQSDTLQDKRLTADQQKEDFRLYRKLLEETHPGLYRYTSKEVIQSRMNEVEESLNSEQSFYDFFRTLAQLNAEIRCAHTYVIPSKNLNSFIRKIKTVPFFFFPINGKPYVLFNGTLNETIKPGFELVSINGIKVDSLRSKLHKHKWSDGYIELAKDITLTGSSFWLFYYSFIDQSESYEMVFKDFDNQLISIESPAQSTALTSSNYKKNPVNKKMLKMYNNGPSKPFKLSFLKDIPDVAALSFNSFGEGDSENEAQQAMRNFMDKSLKKIKKKGSKYLIVDLRNNGGGWDVHGVELLSYLMKDDEPFEYYKYAYTITDNSEFLKYADVPASEREKIKDELTQQPNGTYLLSAEQNIGIGPFESKERKFEGKIYFLINEQTSSAASEFASLAKSYELGVFIGKETNGAYEGGNSFSFIKMSLPNSGIFVNTPLVAGFTNVKPQEHSGRGLLPDYDIGFTREDLMIRNDRQLNFIKKLIRKDIKSSTE